LIINKSKGTSIFGSTDLLDRSTGSIPVVAFIGNFLEIQTFAASGW
jgi:hypothetical protein